MALIKARDPERERLAAIFSAWWDAHADSPVTAATLDQPVLALIDPQGRGRQFVAGALAKLAETRVAGFVLTRQDLPGKWGAATYSIRRGDDATAPRSDAL